MKFLNMSVSLLATAAAQAAFAQESDVLALEPIVVSAVRGVETPVDDATVSVSVVTTEAIEQRATVNTQVGDLLAREVPGLAPSASNQTDYGQTLRGRNFLTLIDGVPQTNLLNNDFRSLNSIGLASVGQIEVVRGATAAYGFGGAGGLINIITKRPEDEEGRTRLGFGVDVQPKEGSKSLSYRLFGSTAKRIDNFDYLLSFDATKSSGSFTADGDRRPPDSFGTQGGLDDVENVSGLAKVGYEVDQHRFEASVNVYNYRQDSDYAGVVSGGSVANNTSATPEKGDLNTETPGVRNRIYNLRYLNDDILGGTMEFQLYHTDRTTTFTRTEFLGFIYPQYETETRKTGARLTFNTPLSNGFDASWGLDLIADETKVNPIDEPYATTPDMSMTGYAPFAQISYDIGGRGTITGGLRYEVLDVTVEKFINENGYANPGGDVDFSEPLFNLSGAYDITPYVTVFGGYSEAFELGSLARGLSDGTIVDVDDSLEGKKTSSYEIGARGTVGGFRYGLTAFYSKSNNGETYDEQLDLIRAEEEIKGIEIELDHEFANGIGIGGTATFMEGRYDTDGDGKLDSDLGSDRVPPTKLTGYVQYLAQNDALYRLDVLHSASNDPDSEQFTGLQKIEAYTLVDLSAVFPLGNGSLRLGIDNLLNEDYVPVLQQAYSVESYGYDDYYYVKGRGRSVSLSYAVEF